jgi:hypothetical protein
MTKLKTLLVSSLICLASGLTACQTLDIPDISPGITLPASGDGWRYSTLSNKEVTIPKAKWEEQKKKGIILFADDWSKLKITLLKNCLSNQCKATAGALDSLFYTIDDALKKIPTPKK